MHCNYDHICLHDEQWQPYRNHFPQYDGLCWFAAMVMAIQSLLDADQAEICQKIWQATVLSNGHETRGIVGDLMTEGYDMSAFHRRRYAFIDPLTGAGGDQWMEQHFPVQFGRFVSELLKLNSIPVEMYVHPPDDASPDELVSELVSLTGQGCAVVVGIRVLYPDGRDVGHAVFLAGEVEEELVVSDSSFSSPYTIGKQLVSQAFSEGLRYRGESRAVYDGFYQFVRD